MLMDIRLVVNDIMKRAQPYYQPVQNALQRSANDVNNPQYIQESLDKNALPLVMGMAGEVPQANAMMANSLESHAANLLKKKQSLMAGNPNYTESYPAISNIIKAIDDALKEAIRIRGGGK